jgi:transcriptional regulator GlxA family with amidase domain
MLVQHRRGFRRRAQRVAAAAPLRHRLRRSPPPRHRPRYAPAQENEQTITIAVKGCAIAAMLTQPGSSPMNIVLFVFDGITALDVVGPYEVLSRLPGAVTRFVAPARGLVRTDNGILGLAADAAIDEITAADLLLVPGGFGTRRLERDARVLAWLRAVDATTRITASVCTGALLVAAAGLLAGRRANTHWAVRERLAEWGAIPVAERVVRDGKYASAAGVSAGIDLALALAVELAGADVAAAIQLGIEYDPAPPLDAGDPAHAPAHIKELVLERMRAREAALEAERR